MAFLSCFSKCIFANPIYVLVFTTVLLTNIHVSCGEQNNFDIEQFKSDNEMLKCGKIISACANKNHEVFIEYKYNTAVDKWERCSWIVAIPNATSYTVEPILIGFKNQAAGLIALGISEQNTLESRTLDGGISRNITADASYLHLIFWSNHLPGSRAYPVIKGFIIRVYVEMGSPTTVLKTQSRVHLFSGDVFKFAHPTPSLKQDGEYSYPLKNNTTDFPNKEVTVIVFQPRGNRLPSSGQGMAFSYRKVHAVRKMHCELQTVKIFTFIVSAEGIPSWELRYIFCEDVKVNELDVSDVVLVVIESSRHENDSLRNIDMSYIGI